MSMLPTDQAVLALGPWLVASASRTLQPLDANFAGLPIGLWDGLIGAVVGGVLTAVGGFLATLYLDHRESQREGERTGREAARVKQERDGAIRLVKYELAVNSSKLEMYIESNALPGQLRDDSFRSVHLLLTASLPTTLSAGLVWAYEQLGVAEKNIEGMRGMKPQERPEQYLEPIRETVRDLDQTRHALEAFENGKYDAAWLDAAREKT